jgi:hypothetical protein
MIKRFYGDKPSIQIISAEGDTHQARRSINAISKAYSPMGASIYNERTIILCDKPTDKAKPGFDQFIEGHIELHRRGQILVLPHGSLEECYPDQAGWRKSEEEVKAMSGYQKKQLAKSVGDSITKEEFEANMPALLDALSRTWSNAF